MKALDLLECAGASFVTLWSIFEIGRCFYQGGEMIFIPIGVFCMALFMCGLWWYDIMHRNQE